MGFFSFLRKSQGPFEDSSMNLAYEKLFCDNVELYKQHVKRPYSYPFDVLFSEDSPVPGLLRIIEDDKIESRLKLLAYKALVAKGYKPNNELLGVVIEVSLDEGPDVLASFNDGTGRYLNHAGGIVEWESGDETSNKITKDLFQRSQGIASRIAVSREPRRTYPAPGMTRISVLASDGLHVGEGSIDKLFNDPLAGDALSSGTALMRYMTERAMDSAEATLQSY